MKLAFIIAGLATLGLATAGLASAVYDFRTPSFTYGYTTEGEVTYTPNPAMVCFLTPYGPGRRALVYRMAPRGRVTVRHDDSLTFFQGYARVLRLGQSLWALDTGDNVSSGFGIPRHGWDLPLYRHADVSALRQPCRARLVAAEHSGLPREALLVHFASRRMGAGTRCT